MRCQGSGCGFERLKEGWQEIARCAGFRWSYILEKDGQKILCTGVQSRPIFQEFPCTKFEGKLRDFKKCRVTNPKSSH